MIIWQPNNKFKNAKYHIGLPLLDEWKIASEKSRTEATTRFSLYYAELMCFL